MAIVYVLISVGKNVLVEYSDATATGNFPTVTRVLLAKIPAVDGQMTYKYDELYQFHYQTVEGVTYLCMSESATTKHRVATAFLSTVRERFLSTTTLEQILTSIAFSYNEAFCPILAQITVEYNTTGDAADTLTAVQNQLDHVKESMVQNIEKVLERGERIELLVDKTDRLNQSAFRFQRHSRELERALYWRKVRCYAYVALAALLLLTVATTSVCGGVDFRHCRRRRHGG